MKILSIETSCDETAISILEAEGNFGDAKFHILANNLNSQIEIHKEYGGVFPALAVREHSKNLIPILQKTLTESKLGAPSAESKNTWGLDPQIEKILEREPELLKLFKEYIPSIEIPEIDAIAVTQGPGLEPALWVGINFAKALSLVWNKPLIPVNHMEGHLLSAFTSRKKKFSIFNFQFSKSQNKSFEIRDFNFPAVGLLISGGHTELVLMNQIGSYEKIGQTRDDAVGEAFDKVARMMDLPYPGGPEISKLAQHQRDSLGGPTPKSDIVLPRPMLNTDDFDFSFSGLKTSVLYLIKKLKKTLSNQCHCEECSGSETTKQSQKNTENTETAALSLAETDEKNASCKKLEELPQEIKQEIALEFEEAVTEILLKKTEKAIEKYGAQTLIIGGGVTANNHIRQSFQSLGDSIPKLEVLMPEREFSTDNAVMIGIAGYFKYLKLKEKGQLQTAIDLGELRAEGNLKL